LSFAIKKIEGLVQVFCGVETMSRSILVAWKKSNFQQ